MAEFIVFNKDGKQITFTERKEMKVYCELCEGAYGCGWVAYVDNYSLMFIHWVHRSEEYYHDGAEC
jgi:hypothetical protein